MRENRTHGSEGGEARQLAFPTPIGGLPPIASPEAGGGVDEVDCMDGMDTRSQDRCPRRPHRPFRPRGCGVGRGKEEPPPFGGLMWGGASVPRAPVGRTGLRWRIARFAGWHAARAEPRPPMVCPAPRVPGMAPEETGEDTGLAGGLGSRRRDKKRTRRVVSLSFFEAYSQDRRRRK